jgi:hypothetical protein
MLLKSDLAIDQNWKDSTQALESARVGIGDGKL